MVFKKAHYYVLYGFVVLVLGCLIVTLLVLDSNIRTALVEENGPIELLTAICYFVCLIPLFRHKVADQKSRFLIAFVILGLGLRELDFHARFTTMEMTKIKFYVSPNVPIFEKMIGVAIIIVLFYCVMYLSKKHFLDYFTALMHMEPYAIGLFFSFLFITISLGLDGFERKAANLGYTFTRDVSVITTVVEEVAELGIPVMIMIAITAYFYTSIPDEDVGV